MGWKNTQLNLENSIARFKGEQAALVEQIAEIEAGIESIVALRQRSAALDRLISAAEMLIRENQPNWSADCIKPRRTTDRNSPIAYGLLGRTALEVLRDGPPAGMRVREIAREVLRRFDLDATDRVLLDRTANTIGNHLKKHEGDLVEADDERFHKRWRLIRPK